MEEKKDELSQAENQNPAVGEPAGQREEPKEPENAAQELSELAEIRQRYEQEIEELKGDLQRERADFINYRRRVQAEKAALSREAAAKLLEKLLPVLDAFEQLFHMRQKETHNEILEKFFEGVAIIQKQLWDVFAAEGLEEINPLNQEFDSSCMEALDIQEGEVDSEMVSSVLQKGYRLPERVLRPARVAVIRPMRGEQQISN
ncbi:MAG: nucleotide exchange factor GrpE [Leptospiraceae bacterium]|nr:nucleotide exchange factor GrpE [Leptospiraceae bacterium]MDW8305994.1 nucleotide exchange factor GrpE [Leptospiraceae bacterium]